MMGVTGREHDETPASTSRRLVVRAVARPMLTITALLLLYYLLPLESRFTATTVVALLVGLVLVAVLLTWQVRGISKSKYPRLRAIEALSFSAPLFLLVFAVVYFVTARSAPESFSEALSRTDALYFVVTVFATVGFGDIVPVTQVARLMVIIQMVGDVILVGVVARAVVGAVQAGLRRAESAGQET